MAFSPDFWHNINNINQQTLAEAVYGGITIAIAASLYYSFFGYILGMSGLVGNVIRGVPSNLFLIQTTKPEGPSPSFVAWFSALPSCSILTTISFPISIPSIKQLKAKTLISSSQGFSSALALNSPQAAPVDMVSVVYLDSHSALSGLF